MFGRKYAAFEREIVIPAASPRLTTVEAVIERVHSPGDAVHNA